MQVVTRIDPYKTVRDDGAGALKDPLGVSFGTIDYVAGTITFNPDVTVSIPWPRYTVTQIGFLPGGTQGNQTPVYRNVFAGFEYKPAAATMPIDLSALVTVKYRAANSPNAVTESITPRGISVDLTQYFSEAIVPGSVNFRWGARPTSTDWAACITTWTSPPAPRSWRAGSTTRAARPC